MLFGLIVIILLIFTLMVIWKLFFGTIDLILDFFDFFPKLCDTIAKSTTALVSKLTSGTSETGLGEVALTLILITAITILLIILTKKFYNRLSKR